MLSSSEHNLCSDHCNIDIGPNGPIWLNWPVRPNGPVRLNGPVRPNGEGLSGQMGRLCQICSQAKWDCWAEWAGQVEWANLAKWAGQMIN